MVSPITSSGAEQRAYPSWSGRQRLALSVLVTAILICALVERWRRQPKALPWPHSPARLSTETVSLPPSPWGSLDLNRASAEALTALPGIGPKLAQRIVAYRDEHGPFRRVDELLRVPGIGPKTLARIRDLVHVQYSDELRDAQIDACPTRPVTRDRSASVSSTKLNAVPFRAPKQLPDEPIDLNTATKDELLRLPGIGPVLAERILVERDSHGPFESVEDLLRVRGIGKRSLEKLRPFVRVGPSAQRMSAKADH
ncbi:MAG: helix-hairpin-helix domain-containing protein [Gemmatales bacterium]|nr:helix-hairpin-helix domain-containing protein [Gemmatales bacterium]MDW7994714.1 helix-hairpin-helix domain-containing protein [Gemmatales bacterium]